MDFAEDVPPIKGGQLVYVLLKEITKIWSQQKNPAILTATFYDTSPFQDLMVLLSPDKISDLTLFRALCSLLAILQMSVRRAESWPSAIFETIVRTEDGQRIGSVHIWLQSRAGVGPISISNKTQNTWESNVGSDAAVMTGLGPRTLCSYQQCQNDILGAPLGDKPWLDVFLGMFENVIVYPPNEQIMTVIKPMEGWKILSQDGKVQLQLGFCPKAFDPKKPLTFRELAQGMLEILKLWAEENNWREGWAEFQKGGIREVTMQISLVMQTDTAK